MSKNVPNHPAFITKRSFQSVALVDHPAMVLMTSLVVDQNPQLVVSVPGLTTLWEGHPRLRPPYSPDGSSTSWGHAGPCWYRCHPLAHWSSQKFWNIGHKTNLSKLKKTEMDGLDLSSVYFTVCFMYLSNLHQMIILYSAQFTFGLVFSFGMLPGCFEHKMLPSILPSW